MEALAKETHKFESRYLDSMIAPYTPENQHIYIERSPFHHIDRFSCPIAFFQGDEDKVKDCVLLFQIGCCQIGFVVCLRLYVPPQWLYSSFSGCQINVIIIIIRSVAKVYIEFLSFI